MMPLHWYKKTNRNPLFRLKRKAAIATAAAGGGAYGLSKLTEADEPKHVPAGGHPQGGYY